METGEVSVFLGPRHLVTVRHGKGVDLAAVRAHAEERAAVLGTGAAAMYAVYDGLVDQYAAVASALEEDVTEIEKSVFSPQRTQDSERIYVLKRELLEMRRAVIPLKDPLLQLVSPEQTALPEQAKPYFRDVADHVARVADTIDSMDRLLDSALDAHLARIQVQQNEDMRKSPPSRRCSSHRP